KGIAREKAGIAKPRVPFVTGEADPDIRAELVKEAKRRGAEPIITVDTTLRPRKDTQLGLRGRHQLANALVAHAVLNALPKPFGPRAVRLMLSVPPTIPFLQRWSIEDMGPDVSFEPDF